jgi:hypothetical protein
VFIGLASASMGHCTFREGWLTHPKYKHWVARCEGVSMARCKLCEKSFSIKNMGEAALASHDEGK